MLCCILFYSALLCLGLACRDGDGDGDELRRDVDGDLNARPIDWMDGWPRMDGWREGGREGGNTIKANMRRVDMGRKAGIELIRVHPGINFL